MFEKSANKGNVEAQNYMGQFYYQGIGVKQNYITAFEWFKKSADKKFPPAQYQVGKMLESGEGIEINEKSAAEYLAQACKAGLKEACEKK
ncbi:tetratricopeptide repeat protein [Providencia hangzhouensis]|uniref:tetratricopeptide repeat protein n=1 Tax=Providencia hangzhouensis TaxID=3031799 RepID=UPI0034DDB96A